MTILTKGKYTFGKRKFTRRVNISISGARDANFTAAWEESNKFVKEFLSEGIRGKYFIKGYSEVYFTNRHDAEDLFFLHTLKFG